MTEFNHDPEGTNVSRTLTAAEAYKAGGEDTRRAIAIAQQLVQRGTVSKDTFQEAVKVASLNLWRERIQKGELPEILS